MLRTKVTELFGIPYPILMGGLQEILRAEFVAAIAEAGGMSFLTAATHPDKERFAAEIRKCRNLTDKPFGVNISMLPELTSEELTMQYVEAAIEEKVPSAETSGRDPRPLIGPLKKAGARVIHKATAPRHAKSAEQAGVDAVILVGYEGAGHPSSVRQPELIRRMKKEEKSDLHRLCRPDFFWPFTIKNEREKMEVRMRYRNG